MVKVLLVSQFQMVRSGLRALLDAEDSLDIIGEASPRDDLPAIAGRTGAEIILFDLYNDELRPVSELLKASPDLIVIVLSDSPSGALVVQALRAGARGYLFKEAASDELVATTRAVAEGLVVLHPAAALAAVENSSARVREPDDGGELLTARELEVLALIAQGLPNKTIANRLHLSEHTVKFHVGSIIGKLGVASRTQAVSVAVHRGLIAL